jgi:hypothetical protein
MVAATAVEVAAFADVPAGDLQSTLGTVYGKAAYAADNVGGALYDANLAKDMAGVADGKAQYAADRAGFLDYHVRAIATQIGYTMPAA